MDNPYITLVKYMLPQEMTTYFDLVKVEEDVYYDKSKGSPENGSEGEQRLHLYLDERAIKPKGREDLLPNGFFEESCVNDFPIREYRTILHIRRRRWKDADGKSFSRDWDLIAQGTRFSKEFAIFLKEYLGYIPDYSSFAPETIPDKR